MYLFEYKTIHPNGKFYIGRHETSNINDGYLGSGKWIKSIKDKSSLIREELEFCSTLDELKLAEQKYIDLCWDNPLCMNYLKSSSGLDSEEARKRCLNLIDEGKHPFQKDENGNSLSKLRVENGTHPFLKDKNGFSIGKYINEKRVKEKTHHFLGPESNKKRIDNGTHNFLGPESNKKRIDNGTHNFLKQSNGESLSSIRVKEGTHNFLNLKGTIACYDKLGNYVRVDVKEYKNQSGEMCIWEYVSMNSLEGRKRKIIRNQ